VQYMAKQKCFEDWIFILVAPQHQHAQLRSALPGVRLRFVKARSFRYAWYLATSRWLVNDVTFPLYFSRRHEQSYLNTWHGTPLKTLGRHINNGAAQQLVNVQRNFFHATHLLAPNLHTESVLLDAYMLRDMWSGEMLRCGYPSNDVFAARSTQPLDNNHMNIAFMPTWRGTLETQSEASRALLRELQELLADLESSLHNNETLWVRLHPMVAGELNLTAFKKIKPFPSTISPYEHLSQCHALITDYSSVLFDFSITGRPIVLYMPDKGEYLSERGFYIDPLDLPFHKAFSPQDLISVIVSLRSGTSEISTEYREFQFTYAKWASAENTSQVCAAFFGLPLQTKPAPVKRYKVETEQRPVLLYTGAMVPNGITRSFMTLVEHLKDVKRNFIVLADTSVKTQEVERFLKNLPENIGFIPFQLNIHMGPLELLKTMLLYASKHPVKTPPVSLVDIWQREVKRLFGEIYFDVFVNFNGYSWRSALLALGADWKKVIYVHNDMAAEVDAGKLLDPRLLELSYRCADTVALVREGMEVDYCHRFYDYSFKAKLVPNCLRTEIYALAKMPLEVAYSIDCSNENRKHVEQLLDVKNDYRFINIARFADEKGQLRLVDAFEIFHKQHPNSQLFIIGGYGPKLSDIEDRVSKSPFKEKIAVILGSNNPFPLVKHCNAFVLSSFYEGLPLTIVEAIHLGLKIVSTDIPGPSEFLAQGYGLLVDNSTVGIAKGMSLAMEGKIPYKPYNIDKHNAVAVDALVSLL